MNTAFFVNQQRQQQHQQLSWSKQSSLLRYLGISVSTTGSTRRSNPRRLNKDSIFSWHRAAVSSSQEDEDEEHVGSKAVVATAAADSYNVQRYRNRAALVVQVLRDKVSEGELLQGKLSVLQQVVRRLQNSAAKGAAVHKDTVLALQQEQERIEQEWQQTVAVKTREWNQTFQALELQSRQYQDDLVKGQDEYQVAASEWQREQQVQLEEQAQAQARIQALQNQILDMDDALETTQQNLMTVQDDSRVQEEDMRAALVREQRRVEHVREELRAVEATRDELQELQNQTQAWEESTEIAKAAVAAAARREAVLLQEWQDFVTTNYTRVQTEKEGFKQQVDELVLQRDNAPPTAGGTPNMSDSDSDSKLGLEIEELRQQVRSLRLTHGSQLRMDQKKAQEKLAELQAEYEEKIERIEQRHRKSSSGTVATDSSRPLSNRSFWQRLKRPFRRR
jgi:hypothetical protein